MKRSLLLLSLLLSACVSVPPPVAQSSLRAQDEDTLLDLARAHGLGFGEITAAINQN